MKCRAFQMTGLPNSTKEVSCAKWRGGWGWQVRFHETPAEASTFAASIPSAQHAVHFSYSPYWFGLFWQHFWASAELYGYAEPEISKISFRDLTENYCKTCWWRKISCGKGGGWWQVCRLAPWICVAHLECMLRFPSCGFCFHREGISGVFTQITHSISFVVFS